MSKQGHKSALQVGRSLPVHKTREEAEKFYFSYRDKALKSIAKLAKKHPEYQLDFSPESLKNLEKLYFDLLDKKAYSKYELLGLTFKRMEQLLAIYYGEVFIKNTTCIWVAQPFGYIENKYYLGIQSENKGMTIECISFSNHYKTPDNKRKQYLYREYMKYSKYV